MRRRGELKPGPPIIGRQPWGGAYPSGSGAETAAIPEGELNNAQPTERSSLSCRSGTTPEGICLAKSAWGEKHDAAAGMFLEDAGVWSRACGFDGCAGASEQVEIPPQVVPFFRERRIFLAARSKPTQFETRPCSGDHEHRIAKLNELGGTRNSADMVVAYGTQALCVLA
ncbi:hypothetical protein S40288_10699 [Stachybotrys chartarum IBT 40288]|nr:hypothetical protein S40288_10699 [Stachybotrys chartarum IBT 40288]